MDEWVGMHKQNKLYKVHDGVAILFEVRVKDI
jgi:hypothetical protein